MDKNLRIAFTITDLWKPVFFITLLCFQFINVQAQNEFYLNGTNQFFNNGALIFVDGNISNNNAEFTNALTGPFTGTIELTGNWINNSISNNYVSSGIERFSGNANQLISGTWNGTTGNMNQFYDLKINKSTGYVSLAQNTHIHAAGTLEFESGGGIIRTAVASSVNTGDYSNYLYVQNPSPNAMSGYNYPAGTSKYIEGKLKRQVNSIGVYEFPIGFQPGSKDGMEAYHIKFNSTPVSTGILGYIRPAVINVIHQNVLCDVGTDPGAGNQPFPLCTGPKDGIFDFYYLDQNLSHEWMAIPDSTAVYDYDITLHPGNNLDNLSYYQIPAACDALYNGKRLRVITNGGVVGGSAQPGAGNYAPFGHLTSYIWCDFDNNTLSSQTSFAAFRLFGTSTSSYTALPVELISFSLTPINNTYFELDWKTASENNNAGFDIERSEDGSTFINIGFVPGNGTTNLAHNYLFEDKNVISEKDYYYRLKQMDINGRSTYTHTIKGRLKGNDAFTVSGIYPNPTAGESTINIYSPTADNIELNLINMLGQEGLDVNYDVQKGWNKIKLDVSHLAAGTYILYVKYKESIYTDKIMRN